MILFFIASLLWAQDQKVPHPQSKQGLIRINRDGSYQYRVPEKPRSRSFAVRVASLQAPQIRNSTTNATYESVYGSNPLSLLLLDYEWMLTGKAGAASLSLGGGFTTVKGVGILQDSRSSPAQERFDLYVIPLTFGVNYRLDFSHRQWLVPVLSGQASYFVVSEKRDDRSTFRTVAAPSVGGGAGLSFGLSRLNSRIGAQFEREYGLADFWITVEGRVLQGLNSNVNFSSSMLALGITSDF